MYHIYRLIIKGFGIRDEHPRKNVVKSIRLEVSICKGMWTYTTTIEPELPPPSNDFVEFEDLTLDHVRVEWLFGQPQVRQELVAADERLLKLVDSPEHGIQLAPSPWCDEDKECVMYSSSDGWYEPCEKDRLRSEQGLATSFLPLDFSPPENPAVKEGFTHHSDGSVNWKELEGWTDD